MKNSILENKIKIVRLITNELEIIKNVECLNPLLGQILPGSKLFSDLELGSSIKIDQCFRKFEKSLLSINEENPNEKIITLVLEDLRKYLEAIEWEINNTLDLSSSIHQNCLLILSHLLPPVKSNNPILFLVSGPSAAGKDYISDNVFNALRARGYNCKYVLKYVQRKSRPEELETKPFLRYQLSVTQEEINSLKKTGELITPYKKFGTNYGFSYSNLYNISVNGSNSTGNVFIAIMSDYDKAQEFIDFIEELSFKVIPILIYADLNICRKRLLDRYTSYNHSNINNQNEALDELWTRSEQVYQDIKLFESNSENIESIYKYRIKNNTNVDIKPIQELYKFIVKQTKENCY